MQEAQYANEAFYLAFEAHDFEAMSHLWSKSDDILCLHPGWPMLKGRERVLESWRSILGNPRQGQVSMYGAEACAWGEHTAVVCCYELAGDTVMIATNVFMQEADGLHMVSHHAGYCANPPEPPES